MKFSNLVEKAKEVIKEYPTLEGDIIEFVQYAKSEIEDDGSEEHECDLAWHDIQELIKKG